MSNLTPVIPRLSAAAGTKDIRGARGSVRPAFAVKPVRRLTPSERAELVERYRSGQTVYQLADKYGIHRHTVSKHLRDAGLRLRLDGLRSEQVDQAVQLYESGWSLARIAGIFGVTATTVHKRLRERGLSFRDTQGRPRPGMPPNGP